MYQLLSMKNNREYIITEEDYMVEDYNIDTFSKEREHWYNKPLFQTMLDYLNIDCYKSALNTFIDFICMFSINHGLDGANHKVDITYLNPYQHIYTDTHTNSYTNIHGDVSIQLSNLLFFEFMYDIFPDDRKKKPISKLKGHRKKGMTINKQFEKESIKFLKKSYEYKYKQKIEKIEFLRCYIDKMNDEKNLLNPSVFTLAVKNFTDSCINFNSSDVEVGHILPLMPNFKNSLHNDFNINAFTDSINSAYSDNGYEEYIVIAKGDLYDGGHNENPFSFDDFGINEFNIVVSDIYFILQQGWGIKKCVNCGKYFVNRSRSDVIYCQNPSPLDSAKTCREYASTRGYYIERQKNELERLRTKVKGRLSKRAQREVSFCKSYDIFRKQDKEWRLIVKNNNDEYFNYFKWLKNVDKITKTSGGKVEEAQPKPQKER